MKEAILKLALLGGVAVGLSIPSGTAHAELLRPGQSIGVNQLFRSDGNIYTMTLRSDGNLVLLRKDGRVIWATGTAGLGAVIAILQHDGNFVLYTADGRPVWYTGTHGPHRAFGIDHAGRVVVAMPGKYGKLDLYLKGRSVAELISSAGGVFEWKTPANGYGH
jgi:hypothetical protein